MAKIRPNSRPELHLWNAGMLTEKLGQFPRGRQKPWGRELLRKVKNSSQNYLLLFLL
jgi:hypothetical protein